jgi:hypothetical protein
MVPVTITVSDMTIVFIQLIELCLTVRLLLCVIALSFIALFTSSAFVFIALTVRYFHVKCIFSSPCDDAICMFALK